jgi:hypothetical protein
MGSVLFQLSSIIVSIYINIMRYTDYELGLVSYLNLTLNKAYYNHCVEHLSVSCLSLEHCQRQQYAHSYNL